MSRDLYQQRRHLVLPVRGGGNRLTTPPQSPQTFFFFPTRKVCILAPVLTLIPGLLTVTRGFHGAAGWQGFIGGSHGRQLQSMECACKLFFIRDPDLVFCRSLFYWKCFSPRKSFLACFHELMSFKKCLRQHSPTSLTIIIHLLPKVLLIMCLVSAC